MTEFTDEYFLNLTMKYDERNDEIYPKWAVWCAKSDDKYYIDGKDGHFYTHVRTDEEIAIERKRRRIMESMLPERDAIIGEDIDSPAFQEFMEYESYINEGLMDDDKVLEFEPISFEAWKASKE